jgi:hypothetical protein
MSLPLDHKGLLRRIRAAIPSRLRLDTRIALWTLIIMVLGDYAKHHSSGEAGPGVGSGGHVGIGWSFDPFILVAVALVLAVVSVLRAAKIEERERIERDERDATTAAKIAAIENLLRLRAGGSARPVSAIDAAGAPVPANLAEGRCEQSPSRAGMEKSAALPPVADIFGKKPVAVLPGLRAEIVVPEGLGHNAPPTRPNTVSPYASAQGKKDAERARMLGELKHMQKTADLILAKVVSIAERLDSIASRMDDVERIAPTRKRTKKKTPSRKRRPSRRDTHGESMLLN